MRVGGARPALTLMGMATQTGFSQSALTSISLKSAINQCRGCPRAMQTHVGQNPGPALTPQSLLAFPSPGEEHGNPLQDSCLENSMDRGAWWAAVHGVTKSWT